MALWALLKRADTNRQKALRQVRAYAPSICLCTSRGVPDLQCLGGCCLQDMVHLYGLRLVAQAVNEQRANRPSSH